MFVAGGLSGCAGSGQVSLARLVSDQDSYLGRQVSTSGRVERQAETNGTPYYVLADPAQDLVLLAPSRKAKPYLGRIVSVRGRFGFDPHAGRVIQIVSIALSS